VTLGEGEKAYSVKIVDKFHHDASEDYIIHGFPTKELAIEFARRRVRSTLEEQRKPNQPKEELRKMWFTFGEDVVVIGAGYAGSSELDFFIDNPATSEECNWISIKNLAGLK